MDFERELNQMLDAMTARAGQRPNRIIMHPDTARTMVSHENNLTGAGGYISRYEGIPITLSTGVEPNKFYLVQDPPRLDAAYSTNTGWWMQSPYGSATSYWNPQTSSLSFTLDTYEEARKSEEPDEIDEKSFLDILNAVEQGDSQQ